MSQFKFGNCIDEFQPRPELTALFHGVLDGVPSAVCRDKEQPRRADGLKPHYGQGTPTVNSSKIDIWGLAKNSEVSRFQVVETSEGSMKIPIEREHLQFLPSADTLDYIINNASCMTNTWPWSHHDHGNDS